MDTRSITTWLQNNSQDNNEENLVSLKEFPSTINLLRTSSNIAELSLVILLTYFSGSITNKPEIHESKLRNRETCGAQHQQLNEGKNENNLKITSG